MREDALDLEALLHPARTYAHPRDVLRDSKLRLDEKRAILASWASDACSVEAAPALRRPDGAPAPVPFDEVMEALQELDRQAFAAAPASRGARRARTAKDERGSGEGHRHIA